MLPVPSGRFARGVWLLTEERGSGADLAWSHDGSGIGFVRCGSFASGRAAAAAVAAIEAGAADYLDALAAHGFSQCRDGSVHSPCWIHRSPYGSGARIACRWGGEASLETHEPGRPDFEEGTAVMRLPRPLLASFMAACPYRAARDLEVAAMLAAWRAGWAS